MLYSYFSFFQIPKNENSMKTYLDRCFSVVVLLFLQFLRVSTQPRNQHCTFPDLDQEKLWRSGTEDHDSAKMFFNGDRITSWDMNFEPRDVVTK